jgi:indolepyruvate ferredoxin oxidoreductase alpha subunit
LKRLLSGNEAIAQGAYEAGVKVASGYPGTPSTEILENLAKYEGIYAEWAPNEKVALEVAIGASLANTRALAAMKHVGVNVAADPLFTLSYTGVEGGLVLVSADDPSLYSSQNEQDNRYYAKFAKIPMLEPTDSQEAKDLVKKAFEISEQYDTPVMLRVTTRIAHSETIVDIGERIELDRKAEFVQDIPKYVMVPAHAQKRHVVVEERLKKLKELSNEFNKIEYNQRECEASVELGIITSGVAYQYAKEVFPDASYLKLSMNYPLPQKLIREFAENVREIYVIEELEPFIEEQVKAMGISVKGKDYLPICGELNPDIVRRSFLTSPPNPLSTPHPKEEGVRSIPTRPPVLCPGCPHRGVFYVLKKLRLNVTGDIGCYTLSTLPPLSALHTCICMGSSIGIAHGVDKAGEKKKTVAVIGDSTFIHSGITGLINIVYNKGTSTVIILDNRTTAMTGGQAHPATGYTLQKEETKALDFAKLGKAIGIEHVCVVDPYDLDGTEQVIREEVERPEPSLIITNRPCILLDRKSRKLPKKINQEVCKFCKLCLRLGCPALLLKEDRLEINPILCAGCGLCSRVCNSDAVE